MPNEWWQPKPIIEEHNRFLVVRDDLVPGGSKMRFLPYLVKDAKEVVFGGPFCGGAPYALSVWGGRTKTKVTLFYAKRKELHIRQKKALKNGATIYQVPYGYMSNVQSKAKKYAKDKGALFLPLGFDVSEASNPFIHQMKLVRSMVGKVDQVWAATGSGMLARCLGKAFDPIPVHGVVVGLASRNEKQTYSPNVTLHKYPKDFSWSCGYKAPFPSCGNYDLKAWEMCQKLSKGKTLFWNVLA
tara:strand:+ start:1970 stop:2695 length:726 start_codon:yes stop_codon:yes gene_type:complete